MVYVEPDGGADHRNSVLDGAYTVGTHVTFTEEMGEKGPQARSWEAQASGMSLWG
jgi:hypothetical protein